MTDTVEFHVPERPYSVVDSLNRRAAALGSPRYAGLTSHANYNGHRVTVSYNDYRRYYITEYFWAGRVVLSRGTFPQCLEAALAEYDQGALGASVSITLRSDDTEAIAACQASPRVVAGREDSCPWYTWRHAVAASCARDMANPRAPHMIFDLSLLEAAQSREEYEAALKARHGRIWNH